MKTITQTLIHKMRQSLFLLLMMCAPTFAGTIAYVTPDGTGDGSSWQNATNSIQGAISLCGNGGEVWIKAGTYAVTQEISIPVKVKLRGGFAGTETSIDQRTAYKATVKTLTIEAPTLSQEENLTILTGQDLNRIFNLKDAIGLNEWGYEDFYSEDNPLIDRLVIQNGRAIEKNGGAIYLEHSALTIENCLILNNVAYSASADTEAQTYYASGGAIYSDNSFLLIRDCRLSGNAVIDSDASQTESTGVLGSGGVISVADGNLIIERSEIIGNSAPSGGVLYLGSAWMSITDSFLENNHASNGDGGVIKSSETSVYLYGSHFAGNYSSLGSGGVMYLTYAGATISGCVFSGNRAALDGGVISSANWWWGAVPITEIVNSTFIDNTAKDGAVSGADNQLRIFYCTFVGNTATASGIFNTFNLIPQEVANTIFKDNSFVGTLFYCKKEEASGSYSMENCVTQGEEGGTNISGDPKLGILGKNGGIMPTMAVAADSVAIRHGMSAAELENRFGDISSQIDVDARGYARPEDALTTIGAYEYNPFPYIEDEVPSGDDPYLISETLPIDGSVKLILQFSFDDSPSAYQWQRSVDGGETWVNETGATNQYLVISPIALADNGKLYRCRITYADTSEEDSMPYEMETYQPFIISEQPAATYSNDSMWLTIGIEGAYYSNMEYQWQLSLDGGQTWQNYGEASVYSKDCPIGADVCRAGAKLRCRVSANNYENAVLFTDISTYAGPTLYISKGLEQAGTGSNLSIHGTEGETLRLEVIAESSDGPLTYKWEKLIRDSNYNDIWTVFDCTNSYYEFVPTMNDSFMYYRCTVSDGVSSKTTENWLYITENPNKLLTGFAQDASVYEGGNATFAVTAESDNPITYLWEYSSDGGETWKAAGSAAATLTVKGVKLAQGGYIYRCTVSDGDNTESSQATLAVLQKAVIGTQPKLAAVYSGNEVALSLVANGDNLRYQWQVYNAKTKAWVDIEGATGAGYTIDAVEYAANGAQYRCAVSNSGENTVYSSTVKLTVYESASITTQPSDAVAETGDSATFKVVASGATLKYQWQVSTDGGDEWSDVSKATAAAYAVSKLTKASDGLMYRVKVYNGGATVYSEGALLTVNQKTTISAVSGNQVAFAGADAQFWVDALVEEPAQYVWQVKAVGSKNWETIAEADEDILVLEDAVKGLSGSKYRVLVSSGRTEGGKVLTSAEMTLTVVDTTAITLGTRPQAFEGGKGTFKVTEKGYGALKYQWQVSTDEGGTWSDIAKATAASYTTPALSGSDFAKLYRCAVTNAAGTVYGESQSVLKLSSASIAEGADPQDVTCANTETAVFTVGVTPESGSAITYKWEVSTDGGSTWKAAGSAAASLQIKNPNVALSGNKYRCLVSNGGNLKTPVASKAATLTVRAAAVITTQPKTITAFEGQDISFSVVANGYNVHYAWEYSSDGKTWTAIPGSDSSALDYVVVDEYLKGQKWMVRCKAWSEGFEGKAVTSSSAAITVNQNPRITKDPVDIVAESGDAASFAVTATGYSLKYQWQVSTDGGDEWSDVSKATAAAYAVSKLTKASDGLMYRVKVYNGGATVYSEGALLTVNQKTTISAVSGNQVAFAGADAQFWVDALVEEPAQYVWQVKAVGSKNWETIAEADEDILVLEDAVKGLSGSKYRVLVSSGRTEGGKVLTSAEMTLTVVDTTAITLGTRPQAFEGGKGTFKVTEKGYGALKYQWQVSTDEGGTWSDIAKATAASYTTPALSGSDFAKLYRCAVTNAAGTVYGESQSVLKLSSASIAEGADPQDVTCANTETAVFTVGVTPESGSAITYKWEVSTDGGSTWKAAGSAAASLQIKNPNVALSGNKYRCLVSNGGNLKTPVASKAATLTVRAAAVITTQPKTITVYQNQEATFSIGASGYNLHYQWEYSTDGGATWNVADEDTGSSITHIMDEYIEGANWRVRCKVWSEGFEDKAIYSSSAGITLYKAADFESMSFKQIGDAQDVTEILGGSESVSAYYEYPITLTAVGTGDNLKYQWYSSSDFGETWETVGGATKAVYTFTAAGTEPGQSQYKCKVYNDGAEAYSGILSVEFVVPPAPASLLNYAINVEDVIIESGLDEEEFYDLPYVAFVPLDASNCKVIPMNDGYCDSATYAYKRITPSSATLSISFRYVYGEYVYNESTGEETYKIKNASYTYSVNLFFDDASDATMPMGSFSGKETKRNLEISGSVYLSLGSGAPADFVGKTIEFMPSMAFPSPYENGDDLLLYIVADCLTKTSMSLNVNPDAPTLGTYSYTKKSDAIGTGSASYTYKYVDENKKTISTSVSMTDIVLFFSTSEDGHYRMSVKVGSNTYIVTGDFMLSDTPNDDL